MYLWWVNISAHTSVGSTDSSDENSTTLWWCCELRLLYVCVCVCVCVCVYVSVCVCVCLCVCVSQQPGMILLLLNVFIRQHCFVCPSGIQEKNIPAQTALCFFQIITEGVFFFFFNSSSTFQIAKHKLSSMQTLDLYPFLCWWMKTGRDKLN